MDSAELTVKAKFIYHLLGPSQIHSRDLEGMNAGIAVDKLISELKNYYLVFQNSYDEQFKERLNTTLESLKFASTIYYELANISSRKTSPKQENEKIQKIAGLIYQKICGLKAHQSIAFLGGYRGKFVENHYAGHAALYEIKAEPNGTFSLFINNTGEGIGTYHKISDFYRRGYPLEYRNIDLKDLNEDFWFELCKLRQTVSSMTEIYDFIDLKLNKKNGNKTPGRKIKLQRTGVCAFKCVSSWIHGKIAPGPTAKKRLPAEELMYERFKKHLIEKKILEMQDPIFQTFMKTRMSAYKKKPLSFLITFIVNLFKSCFKIHWEPHIHYKGERLVNLLNHELQKKKNHIEMKIRNLEKRV
ncbi:MAG: hypothetical protein BGO14_07690 [Chlamydiales bacterium 38-26]|nr:hypothetical protein [Chlamydiales bacterium]OJV10880.1 MAG: hypothetical protein BGO14_07690 [Chlamydiales bacterium 38-26]